MSYLENDHPAGSPYVYCINTLVPKVQFVDATQRGATQTYMLLSRMQLKVLLKFCIQLLFFPAINGAIYEFIVGTRTLGNFTV